MTVRSISPAGAAPRDDARAIRGVARQLESVFVAQMFAAMRSTAGGDGIVPAGQGEEMFRGMLDEKVADRLPAQFGAGDQVAHAIERALGAKLAAQQAHRSGSAPEAAK